MNHCGLALLSSNAIELCNAHHLVADVTCSSERVARGVLGSNFHLLALELFTTSWLGNYSERLLGCNIILCIMYYVLYIYLEDSVEFCYFKPIEIDFYPFVS